ncbi:Sua5/YciO/YrdC/YwlC protein [Deinococcus aerius]|uniref:L-threonylcarbamoyladenylate synthase n=1 Tax=Deinococcus aerius TaxID=200253 RepID=A0A2I9CR01_9DEIO|nr:L-threonylcarbamoyladenylate synthase [Deinococcus aerius]GBF03903.1 Sua5/YciO/YrdC/YwlC protein [Deinococcus aerius]
MKEQPHSAGGVGDAVARAADLLASGGVVGYPTETVWGLAASPEAVDRLYALKGRDDGKPVQVSCVDAETARALTRGGAAFEALAPLWPGPLTLVLPATPACPPALAPGGWVGLRVPDHPVALALLRACGGTLATTSLNPSGQPAARTFAEARAYGLAPLLLPDGGVPARGLASTVVRVDPGGSGLEVLREGALPVEVLRERLRAAGVPGGGA